MSPPPRAVMRTVPSPPLFVSIPLFSPLALPHCAYHPHNNDPSTPHSSHPVTPPTCATATPCVSAPAPASASTTHTIRSRVNPLLARVLASEPASAAPDVSTNCKERSGFVGVRYHHRHGRRRQDNTIPRQLSSGPAGARCWLGWLSGSQHPLRQITEKIFGIFRYN